ncbi:MAG: hypothetical protein JWR22_2353 [Herminiimonas sp.]|nr:hypothetical protein [Herminiimonas sp.]
MFQPIPARERGKNLFCNTLIKKINAARLKIAAKRWAVALLVSRCSARRPCRSPFRQGPFYTAATDATGRAGKVISTRCGSKSLTSAISARSCSTPSSAIRAFTPDASSWRTEMR